MMDAAELLDSSPDALWGVSEDGRITFANRVARELLPGAVVGADFRSLTDFRGAGRWRASGLSLNCSQASGGFVVTGRPVAAGSNLGAMFEQAPAPIVILSGPRHQVVFANAVYREYFLPSGEYLGQTIEELLPEAAEQGFVEILNRVYQTGESFAGKDIHFILATEEGSTREFYLNLIYEPLRDSAGQVEGIIAVITDLTDQVRHRQQLAFERHKLEEIFRDTPAALALWRGPDLVFEKVNPVYQSIFGDRSLVGKPLAEALPELKAQAFPELLRRVLETGEPVIGTETLARVVTRKGGEPEERYYDFTYFRIHDLEGKPYGVFDHAVDVTPRVLSRLALEESQAQLARAIRVAKIGFFDWDLPSNTLTLSEQMQNDWQVSAGACVEEVASRIHPDDRARVERAFTAALESGQKYCSEYRLILPDGREIWVEAQGEAVSGEDGRPIRFGGTAIDISERRRRQAELEAAKQEAERANQTKTLFLANMSHEIRTPLGAILGFADLLRADDLEAHEREEFLEIITRNGRSLMRIIDDILDLAKVESGKLETEILQFSPLELLQEVQELLAESARSKGLGLSLHVGPTTPALVNSDPTRLRQIFVNLMGNAIKFTTRGSVSIRTDVVGQQVVVRISDTGPGIPAEQRSRLFQPFVQADGSTTRRYGGTGLGLVLSQRLARLLGGDVVLEDEGSEPGCIFRVTFSAWLGAQSAGVVSPGSSSGARPLQGRRLLVADDTADNRLLIRRLLMAEGAVVETVDDGEQAVRAALSQHFDAVLLDLQMPVMDGYEAVRRLRACGYARPVVALTAHAMREERERTRAAGCVGHLTKPIDATELLNTLLAVLE